MPKYLVLYVTQKRPAEQQIDEIRRGKEPWITWFKAQGSAIVDQGNPTAKPFALNKKGSTRSRLDKIVGYSIVESQDPEKLKAMVIHNPHLDQPKTSIEILQIMPLM